MPESLYRMGIRGKCEKSFLREFYTYASLRPSTVKKIFGGAPNIFDPNIFNRREKLSVELPRSLTRHERDLRLF